MNDQAQGPAEPQTGSKRRRARKACLPCRQRKRKCDGAEPCSMCTNYGYDCVYAEDSSPLAPFVSRPSRPKQQKTGAPTPQTDGDDSGGEASVVSPQNHDSVSSVETGVLDPERGRYVGASSAIAFPRTLSIEFQSKNPPALHSFGYTFGIRPEEHAETHGDLREMITQVELKQYSAQYFSHINSIFDLLDQSAYTQRCRNYWINPMNDVIFGATIAGAVALGSFISYNTGMAKETDLVQFAKKILEDPRFMRRPTIDQIVGWALRTLYLRATTRPNNAWLSSCIGLHLAEALGLHDEACILRLAAANARNSPPYLSLEPERLRRIFWSMWSSNLLTSTEYGRSYVSLPSITCADVKDIPGNFLHLHVRIAKTIPTTIIAQPPDVNSDDQKASLFIGISLLMSIPSQHPFVMLTKADLCFCYYRRLRQQKVLVPPNVIDKIIHIGLEGLESSVQFAKEGRAYWPVLGSTFQFSCILLAMDTPSSLAHVARAFRALEDVVNAINTRQSREALATARLLLRDAMGKKRRDLASLEEAEAQQQHFRRLNGASGSIEQSISDDIGQSPSGASLDVNWDQIFEETWPAFAGLDPAFPQDTWPTSLN